jgi:SAM-dependent methyltransferase
MGVSSARGWWQLAPMEWIQSVWQPQRSSPRRILVAGCGTGLEALALRRRFPEAEIVAVDFSPRSIAAARQSKQSPRPSQPIRFVVADLADRQFASIAGEGFDFITCHGVLSYVARPERALRNLARCLEPDGALYLGVNGAGHFSVGARPFMSALGFDMAEFCDGRGLRNILKLHDTILGEPGNAVAKRKAGYLASDLFGPVIHNLPLKDWVGISREAGLHLLGCYGKLRPLRSALNCGLSSLLKPRSRAEVSELVDMLVPTGFHRLLLSKSRPAEPPWGEPERLLDWRPAGV